MSHAHADSVAASLSVAVLTISDTRELANDTSGNYLVQALEQDGHVVHDRRIVKDDIYAIRAAVSAWIADPQVAVVLTTGGTGFAGRDSTPEAVSVLFDKTIDGFGELRSKTTVSLLFSSSCLCVLVFILFLFRL